MESRESKDSILAHLFDMFRNHPPEKILSTCEEKQWKIEDCIESLLQNVPSTRRQGAVPKTVTRNTTPTPPGFENPAEQKILNLLKAGSRVMVIMRGAPGSGKSSLARLVVQKAIPNIKYHEFKNFIFSTDDYFTNRRGNYNRQVSKLQEAHSENQRKVNAKAMTGSNLIVVDNTNLQIWEMLPYVEIAVKNGYTIVLLEPKTPWRHNAEQLALKNSHGVPVEKIKSMLNKYEPTTVKQLIQMVNGGRNTVQSRNNLPNRNTQISQNMKANFEPRSFENNAEAVSLGVAPLPQRQNFRSKNSQTVSTANSANDGPGTVAHTHATPFQDITSHIEANNNIPPNFDNFSYQRADIQRAKDSVQIFNNFSTNAAVNMNTQPIQHDNVMEVRNDGFVEVQVNASIISQLHSIFGPEGDDGINILYETGEYLNVLLPLALAKDLYKLCRQAKLENVQKERQIVDENFAKLIQNTKYSEIGQAPENLQELLDYEMALRLLNSEKNERQQSGQETLATLIARLKVTENSSETPKQPEETFEATKTDKNITYGKEDKSLALSEFEEYRNLAVHHCQLKAECYQKAKEMVQKGNNAVAGYYSQIAQFHKKKVDMYNERAANCIVEVHRLTSDNRDLLDLHHLHLAEAIECLDLFLDHHITSTRNSTRTYKNVFIITGRGLHSTGGVSVIKNKVKGRLKDRNLKWNEVNPGLLKVKIFSSSLFSN